jgi:hypothetical protein
MDCLASDFFLMSIFNSRSAISIIFSKLSDRIFSVDTARFSSLTAIRATVALYLVAGHDAVLLYPRGFADGDGGLVGRDNRADGTGRANPRAGRAFRSAIAFFVGHLGLHQGREPCRRAQHVGGTRGDAKLAGGAVPVHVARVDGSRGTIGVVRAGIFLS